MRKQRTRLRPPSDGQSQALFAHVRAGRAVSDGVSQSLQLKLSSAIHRIETGDVHASNDTVARIDSAFKEAGPIFTLSGGTEGLAASNSGAAARSTSADTISSKGNPLRLEIALTACAGN
jgi:hypothetical protein